MPAPAPGTIRCKHCRYRLDGLDEHRCPECGNAFDPDDPETFDLVQPFNWQLLLVEMTPDRRFVSRIIALIAFVIAGFLLTGAFVERDGMVAGIAALPMLFGAILWFIPVPKWQDRRRGN